MPIPTNALIVVESQFGNTEHIAHTIATTLTTRLGAEAVSLVRTTDAPETIDPAIDTLIVGAPTHALSLSTAQTRTQAADQGAKKGDERGAREWIEQLAVDHPVRVFTFGTSVDVKLLPGAASASLRRAIRKQGIRDVTRGPSFFVDHTAGPLKDGELERARAWATAIADGTA